MATATKKRPASAAKQRPVTTDDDVHVIRGKLEELWHRYTRGDLVLNMAEREFICEVMGGGQQLVGLARDKAEQIIAERYRPLPPGATSTATPAGIAAHDPDALPATPRAIVPIAIEFLIVDYDKRRCLDQDKVQCLAESFKESGLLQPIGVRQRRVAGETLWECVWGAHRVAAAASLGWVDIPAVVVTCDDAHAEMAEIDENLIRSPLTALEQAEAIARRKEIYEALHPETKRGAKGGRQSRKDAKTQSEEPELGGSAPLREVKELDPKIGSNSAAKPLTPKDATVPSFVDDTASKTGQSRSGVAAKAKLGSDIPKDVMRKLRNTAIADNESELRKLAKLLKSDPDKAATVVEMLASCEVASVTEALAGEEDSRRPRTPKPAADPAGDRQPPKPAEADPQMEASEEPRAGAGLRTQIDVALYRWRNEYKEDASSILAACILEQIAAELREQFVSPPAKAGRKPR